MLKEKTVNVAGIGSVNLDQLLSGKKYGKIYLMLGINELGYNQDNTVQRSERAGRLYKSEGSRLSSLYRGEPSCSRRPF